MSTQSSAVRICFVTPEYPPHVGGAARSAQRLIKGLAETGFEVVVFTAVWPGQTSSWYTEDGALIYRIPFSPQSLLGLIDSEDEQQPFDIFHGFSLTAAYPCLGFASRGDRPVIASIRGIDGMEFDKLAINVLRRSSWFTSVSSDSLDRAMAVRDISNCSTVIPNSIDLSRFSPWRSTPTNQGIVGTIATFRPKKNIPLLIEAYSRVPINIRKQLLLVGDSFQGNTLSTEGRKQLDQIIENLGLASEVEITGYVDNARLSEYQQRMRVFALSSDHEGMPNALLEAAAAGMPIVATAVDGVKDIFTNGKDALLVEPGNPVLLSEAIESVLTDEGLACRLGSEARATAAQLTREEELKRYVELYRVLLSKL